MGQQQKFNRADAENQVREALTAIKGRVQP
jgi:hypothetical protein